MPHQATNAHFIWLIVLVASLPGCERESPFSDRLIADLERANIPVPDAAGQSHVPDTTTDLPASGLISLADLLRVAEARSPALAAARSGVGVAAGRHWQASLYPNPRADLLTEDISWRAGLSDAKTTIGITQPIIIGDRRHAAMDAADAEQAARMAEVEVRRRELFGDIAMEHARLLAVREQERIYGELRELADRTLASAQTRFEAKAAPETDVIRPRVEACRIEAALWRLAQEKAAASRRLALLLGGVEVDPARLDGTPPLNPDVIDVGTLQTALRATHPLLAVADREIEAAAADLRRVKAEVTPDLDVRVAAGYRDESDDGIVEVGAGMAIPLWDAREGDILSARFELMRRRQRRIAIENDLLGRLAEAVGEHEAARGQLDTFRDRIVPDARRAFEQTGEGYRAGRSSFLDLLDSQRTLTEARITLAELAGGVAAARARIIQVVGSDGLNSPTASSSAVVQEPSPLEERPSGAEVKP